MIHLIDTLEKRVWFCLGYIGVILVLLFADSPSSFQDYVDDMLFWIGLVFLMAVVFIIQASLYRILIDPSEGWKRVGIVTGFVGLFSTLILVKDEISIFGTGSFQGDEIMEFLMWASIGLAGGFATIAVGRWIVLGFSKNE